MKTLYSKSGARDREAVAADWIVRRERGLDAAQQAELAAWEAADTANSEALRRHEQAWTFLGRPAQSGRGPEMIAQLTARATRRRRHRQRLASAGVALVLVAMAVWWTKPWTAPGAVPVANALVIMPRTEVLPDGTVVELKADARITMNFSEAYRRVSLDRGEALFKVAKNPQRPFIVAAGDVEVRAVGTEFLVDSAQEKRVDVIVTEGRVAVERPQPTTDTESTAGRPAAGPAFVDAGSRVIVDLAAPHAELSAMVVSAAEVAEKLEWRTARLEFSYTRLADAVALFNRHSAIPLVIDDATLADLPVNGRFRADNTETLVRLLEANFGVEAVRADGKILLRRAR